MPFLKNIVTEIDRLIVESSLTDQRFQNRFFAGLVEQVPIQSKTPPHKTIFVPLILSGVADAQEIRPDDAFNIQTYHRVISNAYEKVEVKQQFGDGFEAQKCISDMIMIVIGFNNKLLLTSEQTEALIISGMPTTLNKKNTGTFVPDLQMHWINIQETSSNLNSVTIFNQEYSGDTYYIKTEMSLFQIRYKIEAVYKKGCFTICEDC